MIISFYVPITETIILKKDNQISTITYNKEGYD
jgi:hypothetical protein